MDYIVRATAADGQIRAFAATTRETVETARQDHNTSPVATAALPGGGLVAHGADYVAGGADEGDAGGLAGVGKVGVLTEEAVAGVDGVAPGGLGHGEDGIDV